jgi:hypothetical protein
LLSYIFKPPISPDSRAIPDLAPKLRDVIYRPPPETFLGVGFVAEGEVVLVRDVRFELVHLRGFGVTVRPELAANHGFSLVRCGAIANEFGHCGVVFWAKGWMGTKVN